MLLLFLYYRKGEHSAAGYTLEKGLLYKNQRLVIPKGSAFIPRLLHQFHASTIGGHEGFFKTFKRLSQEVFWKGMHKDVVVFITHCQVC